MSKHGPDNSQKEETIVPADTDTEPAEEAVEDKAVEESTEIIDEPTEIADETPESTEPEKKPKRRIPWARVFAFGVLPALALLLAMSAGYLKWVDSSVRDNDVARMESTQAAKDSTIALLSYKPDTVEQQLGAARDLLTGDFRDSYTSLTHDVVIPGAKQKQISAVATVPAVASVSAKPDHAVVLVFVNQTVVVGQDAPTDTASSVRVTLDKVGNRWLISKFDPV
jgi:Mce-associated membrane protein